MPEPMPNEVTEHAAPHLPRFARQIVGRDVTARRAVFLISGVTIVMAVAGGILIRLLDKKDFSSIGEGLWWSLQTVTTVGYGDIVPNTTEGRIIAGLVMLTGIAFIAVITASVTAALIEGARRDQREQNLEKVTGALHQVEARLAAIEAKLEQRD